MEIRSFVPFLEFYVKSIVGYEADIKPGFYKVNGMRFAWIVQNHVEWDGWKLYKFPHCDLTAFNWLSECQQVNTKGNFLHKSFFLSRQLHT